MIRLAQTQLIIVSPPYAKSKLSKNSASFEQSLKSFNDETSRLNTTDLANVTIFDLDDKLVAYSGDFEGGIRDAWDAGRGDICVLTDDGTVIRLIEKTLRQKLDILFRKSLYLLATGVAKSHLSRCSPNVAEAGGNANLLLGDIHRKYGDHLYEKGEYEGAVNQFIKTIGVTQPSYVIRKFLDAQRIRNLTSYLQELHALGYANSDHTTLLLNCYAKLKDVKALDRFIRKPLDKQVSEEGDMEDESDDEGKDGQDQLPFDLNTAIHVCRQGGYFQHAAYLAKRYKQHDEYLRIQVDDLLNFSDVMEYIRTLTIEDARRNLLQYGSKILSHDPEGLTDLLIELCSGAFQPTPSVIGAGVDASKVNGTSTAAYLSYLKVGSSDKQQHDVSSQPNVPSPHRVDADLSNSHHTVNDPTRSKPPSPNQFFALFVEHKNELIRFLESVALARWGQSVEVTESAEVPSQVEVPIEIDEKGDLEDDEELNEQKSVWHTLLELYLTTTRDTQSNAIHDQVSQSRRRRAFCLLLQHTTLTYDVGHALITCVQEHFSKGTAYLLERLGSYEDIIRQSMDDEEQADLTNNVDSARQAGERVLWNFHRYKGLDANLYPLMLKHLVSSKARMDRHETDLEQLLTEIFDDAIMLPLEVVQVLSKTPMANVGLIRKHLIQALDTQQADIATNASLTQTYRSETQAKLTDIKSLEDEDQPRIFQQTRCNACNEQMDLPSVHFMCRHSFHARCLGDGENECPVCAKSHSVILEIRRNNLAFGQRHDL